MQSDETEKPEKERESWGRQKRGRRGEKRGRKWEREGKSGEKKGEEIERKTMWIWGERIIRGGTIKCKEAWR